ncbi:MAG TPA: HNH endonuclease signature motif containing protein [Gemmatimonadaceae bacterium]|nr:HNH endonuclease signature motif containing protein [Gemmatimonadaceae bacterium]
MRREQVFERDDYRCVYCGERFDVGELTVDHVQPRMRGGDHSSGNLVTACCACNARKGGLRVVEFLRADPVARENFLRLARAVVWQRIVREIERG